MPSLLSGEKTGVPVTLRWGTFCRDILVDAATQQTMTLVGVLPVVNLALKQQDAPTLDGVLELPLSLWVHAVFDFAVDLETNKPFHVTTRFQFDDQKPVVQELPFVRKPGQDVLSVNLQLNPETTILRLRTGKFMAKMSFRFKATDLGIIEVPFVITIQ